MSGETLKQPCYATGLKMIVSEPLEDSERALTSMPVVRIEPARSRLRLRTVTRSWPVIKVIALRDLKARYKQSLLGPIWIAFQPLALLAGFIVGFKGVGNVHTGGVPYALFALAGVTFWSYFQAAMTAGTASILGNGALVRKSACPRFAFPISALLSTFPSFVFPFVATVIASAVEGRLSPQFVLAPLLVVWLFAVVVGTVLITSSISVRFRDILSALPFLLQVGAFLVPVGYPVDTLGPTLRVLVSLNPLTGLIEAWRWVVLGVGDVYMPAIYISLVCAFALVIAGWKVFGRFEVRMADVI